MNNTLKLFLEGLITRGKDLFDYNIENIEIIGVLEKNIDNYQTIASVGDNSFKHETIGEIIVSFNYKHKIFNEIYEKIMNLSIQREFHLLLQMALDELCKHDYIQIDVIEIINLFGSLKNSRELPFYMRKDGWKLIEFDVYCNDSQHYYYQLNFQDLFFNFTVINPNSRKISELEKVNNFRFSRRLLEAISESKTSTILTKNLSTHFSEEWMNEQQLIYEVEK